MIKKIKTAIYCNKWINIYVYFKIKSKSTNANLIIKQTIISNKIVMKYPKNLKMYLFSVALKTKIWQNNNLN